MIFNKRLLLGFFAFFAGLEFSIFSFKTLAQSKIIPDNTLGAESSRVIPNFNTFPVEVITGGATRGINIFHSFQEFNISAGRGAYFFVPNANIENILARVTGNNRSEILGILGTFGSSQPNLYLINPNGIIFGQNAELDIGGSFVATTANAVQFPGGGEFSLTSTVTRNNSLLSVNPTAFLFNQIANQSINSIENRAYLAVPENKSLILLGGNISPTRESTGEIFMDTGILEAGRIEIGGLNASGTVGLTVDGGNLGLSFSPDAIKTDISLVNQSFVFASGASASGDVVINANNFNLINFSNLFTLTPPNEGNADTKAGDIFINANASVTIAENSTVQNYALGLKNNPHINITGQSLNIEGSYIDIGTAPNNSGTINIQVDDTISLFGKNSNNNFSRIFSTVLLPETNQALSNAIKSSDINIQATNVLLADGARLITDGSEIGNSGNIKITAFNFVNLKDGANISTLNYAKDTTVTGNISISSNWLRLDNNSRIITGNVDNGNAGDINIISRNINLDKSRILSGTAFDSSFANAGNINIETEKIILTNSANITTESNNSQPKENLERGGNINVKASELIEVDTKDPMALADQVTGFFTRIGSTRSSGDITLTTKNLILKDGGAIATGLSNNLGGNTGSINIDASESIQLYSSNPNYPGLISTTVLNSNTISLVNKAGDLTIKTNRLHLAGGLILSANFNRGNAGNISVFANDVLMIDQGNISSGNTNQGNAGDISIFSNNGVFIKNGGIFSSNISEGNAGNISIVSNAKVVLNKDGSISSGTVGQGKAGNISIFGNDAVIIDSGSIFSSTSADGDAGNINIQTRKLDVTNLGVISSGVLQPTEFSLGGKGNAGSIIIDAADAVTISGYDATKNRTSIISTATQAGAIGRGGDIIINTDYFRVGDSGRVDAGTDNSSDGGSITINARVFEAFAGGIISTSTDGSGKAGNITINALNDITLSGINSNTGFFSSILAATTANSSGDGGTISLSANNLYLTEAQISARSEGLGDAGNININIKENYVGNDSPISARSEQSGGGNINITARNIRLQNDADIRTDLLIGEGSGGNIFLSADTIIALEDSDILAFAPQGKGGNITFNTRALFSDALYNPTLTLADRNSLESLNNNNRSDINATGAISGNIIGVPDITFIQNSLTELQSNSIDTNVLIANSCIARNPKQEGTFIITGAGGLPTHPGDASGSTYSTGDVQNVTVDSVNSQWKKGDRIIEPQGVYRLANGQLVMSRECD
ncbi:MULTISPECIES: filamentous hemagglutinin N-terminal domain-containing protein [Nostoc]|uniref:Filamentous hemagglutinin N-terminal domain-containing protein n=1 Tax=Nostoc paludosum FACHB-159 TaxID=2692908 RepID=A0ABR8K1M7_9NOSO|nr:MULTISPECIES: filamentous hemagglutinin N-terminal domain-containing protein [Nostoc]MBD2677112.1 filamentous hemagglutinin N-terminal domain-containing protein [Nostoc sp. FACHB-857]MBD2733311.1 filamentous hemagglutinin N-terminal domain-containing protein [Nostoc paludosum FACHB-159]